MSKRKQKARIKKEKAKRKKLQKSIYRLAASVIFLKERTQALECRFAVAEIDTTPTTDRMASTAGDEASKE